MRSAVFPALKLLLPGGKWTARHMLLRLAAPLLFLHFFFPWAASAGSSDSRLVVVLYPDNSDGRPANTLADQSIRSTIAGASSQQVRIHNEYLDISGSPDSEKLQAEFLRRKYGGRKVDLVIVCLSPALDFALKYRNEIFPGVPVIFGAVDERELRARELPPDVIGVPVRVDLAETLDDALRFHPETERVVVVAGKARLDAYWEAEARRDFQSYQNKAQFTYLAGLPLEDLLRQVSHLPAHSIIYYLHVLQDGTGKVQVPADVLERLAAVANAPIYGHVDSFVGHGLVGGCVVSFEIEGKNMAKLGLRILAGQKPEAIGIQQTSPSAHLFDGRQLRRWNINDEALPPESIVRNGQPKFWEVYKWHIIAVVSLCIVETLLVAGLLIQRATRRQAHLSLRESEERFRLMADTAPVMVWMSGSDKRCTYFNRSWLEFTGRSLQHEIGDGWTKGVHPADLANCLNTYSQAFDTRKTFRMEYRLKRYDGAYRWVVDIGVPRFKSNGTFEGYIGSCLDITDQKDVEEALRENQRELRVLTGKLLHSQETERRRIARELHDDLNQSLALLSVEMEVLSHKPPNSATELVKRMQELSERVKQLSSSVHDLSHQLHPSKLEQLGLVAAVRGLCKELSRSHGVPIEFTGDQFPDAIPEEIGLCLYRIVQEALGNVVKHSGAEHAGVELHASADTIYLQINDDGGGFDPNEIDGRGGLGLVSMRERLHLVRGHVAIDSRPEDGTRIEVRVPLRGRGAGREGSKENANETAASVTGR
jgi:PAS domain S-box-containing protein